MTDCGVGGWENAGGGRLIPEDAVRDTVRDALGDAVDDEPLP